MATAGTLRDARRQMALQQPDIVLLDLQLPDGSGMELFDDAEAAAERRGGADHRPRQRRDGDRGAAPAAPPTTWSSRSSLAQLQGVLSRVTHAVDAARPRSATCATSCEAIGRFGHAVGPLGADAARLRADRARRAAPRSRCFITGESGTGKELVAQTVHDLSRRRKQPFLAVNCGAISPQPDRERALRPREGQLHRRRPPAPGLLRARQRRHAVPRRDHRDAARAAGQAAARARDRHASCASASTQPMRDRRARHRRHQPRSRARRCAEGKLREDLLYRLNVFPIAAAAAARARRRHRAAGRALPRRDLQARRARASASRRRRSQRCARYRWPGNVRELRNVVQRAYVMRRRRRSSDDCLPRDAGGAVARRRRRRPLDRSASARRSPRSSGS